MTKKSKSMGIQLLTCLDIAVLAVEESKDFLENAVNNFNNDSQKLIPTERMVIKNVIASLEENRAEIKRIISIKELIK